MAIDLTFFRSSRLPVLLQSDDGSCGRTCIAMMAGYWGNQKLAQQILDESSTTRRGVSLATLIETASSFHFNARAVRLELAQLASVRAACILHWNFEHFVVLRSVRGDVATIHDPAVGVRKLSLEELSRHFTGVALEVTPSDSFVEQEAPPRIRIRQILGRVAGLRRGILGVFLLAVLVQLLLLLGPLLLQLVVDTAIPDSDKGLAAIICLGYIASIFLQTATSAVKQWLMTVMATELNSQWLSNGFAHLLRLPISFFESRQLGDILSRFGSIQSIQRTLTTQAAEALLDGCMTVITFLAMLTYMPWASLLSLVVVGIYAVLRLGLVSRIRRYSTEQLHHTGKQQSQFIESTKAIASIRIFGRESVRYASWVELLTRQFNSELAASRIAVVLQGSNGLLFGVERVITIWIAAIVVIDGEMSIGMLLAYVTYKELFSSKASGLIDKIGEIRGLQAHTDRVADIVLSPKEDEGSLGRTSMESAPVIELANVSFRYSEGEDWVLRDVSLRIESGESIAIVGPSGSGKTTLAKIMLGLVEPTSGSILVDGVPLERFGKRAFRSLVGTCLQDDQLMAGSISENISFFDEELNQGRVEECAKMVAMHAEILRMPMGYRTKLAESGSGLSSGQKQRIMLARALYRKPKVLLLDEATSHLDVANERHVNAAVADMRLTRIVIAHRPETIAMASRVFRIGETGIAGGGMSSEASLFVA